MESEENKVPITAIYTRWGSSPFTDRADTIVCAREKR